MKRLINVSIIFDVAYIYEIPYRSFCLAAPDGRAVQGVGLRPLFYWDCGFEYRWGHG
jgi:hypothetical protein